MAGSVVASALTFCVGIGVLLAGQTSAGILFATLRLRHHATVVGSSGGDLGMRW